jgi:hypothetical protein
VSNAKIGKAINILAKEVVALRGGLPQTPGMTNLLAKLTQLYG